MCTLISTLWDCCYSNIDISSRKERVVVAFFFFCSSMCSASTEKTLCNERIKQKILMVYLLLLYQAQSYRCTPQGDGLMGKEQMFSFLFNSGLYLVLFIYVDMGVVVISRASKKGLAPIMGHSHMLHRANELRRKK